MTSPLKTGAFKRREFVYPPKTNINIKAVFGFFIITMILSVNNL